MITIDFDRVGLSFGGNALFSDLTVSIPSGKVTVVSGRNGSGKSTLLMLAAKLLLPDAGEVAVMEAGVPLKRESYRGRLAMVRPEWSIYPHLTAEENLRFFLGLRGVSLGSGEAAALFHRVGLSMGEVDGCHAERLSTGMRQRVKLAILIASDADVWLLDEPGANLDPEGVRLVLEESRRAAATGRLVMLATNDPREEAAADEAIHLPWSQAGASKGHG